MQVSFVWQQKRTIQSTSKIRTIYKLQYTMLAAVVALLVFVAAVYVASTIWENRHLPPGPFPLPVLGNLLSIGQRMPYRDLANMAKKHGKVFRVHMGSRKVIVLSSYELAREALVTKAKDFAGRPPHLIFGRIFGRNYTDIATQTFSQRWKVLHKLAVTALRLTEDKVKFSSHIEELCAKFRSYVGKPFYAHDNVFKSIGTCISSMIFAQEHKLDESEVDMLVQAVHVFRMSLGAANLINAFPIFRYIPFEVIRKAQRAGEVRDEIFERKFRQHVSTFQKDNIRSVLDAMLREFQENCGDSLTEENLISRWENFLYTVSSKNLVSKSFRRPFSLFYIQHLCMHAIINRTLLYRVLW